MTRPKPVIYGPFDQEDSLDGVLVSVSGANQTVRLQLQNGDIRYTGIETNRETARQIARHMFRPVRIFGTGRWLRDPEGKWILKKFRLARYTVPVFDDLKDAIEKLRATKGSEWGKMDDPLGTLRALRDKDDDFHS